MNQHPVPRNVTGFQFQLIGSMTLKQFVYLLFGLVVGFVLFKSPISILRIPLAVMSVFAGVAFAFLPIQERPLEAWIVNFIKSIYAPTLYVWKKESVLPAYLAKTHPNRKLASREKSTAELHHEARAKLDQYLRLVSAQKQPTLDAQEQEDLRQVRKLFETTPSSPMESLTIKTRKTPANTKKDWKNIGARQPLLVSSPITGVVKNSDTPLPNVLVHIYDKNGAAVRLLKTNKQGKFATNIPLAQGQYFLEVEDPSKHYVFRKFAFTIDKAPLRPWLIQPEVVH